MKSGRFFGLSAAVLVLTAVWACGSDDDGGGSNPDPDGGLPDGTLPDGAMPPTPAEFGLDTRPANTTCKAPARPPSAAPVKFQRVYENVGLGTPMVMAQKPGDPSKWFVAQRGGNLVTFPTNNPGNATTQVVSLPTLAGIPIPGSALGGEGGFLGMAFHPKFAQNGRLYVSWTPADGTVPGSGFRSEIGYMTSPDGGLTFTAYKKVFSFPQTTATNHKGGAIAFGPKDGLLYASFGDGGNQDDFFGNGQNLQSNLSKILRFDVDTPAGGEEYSVPNGNPFKNGGGNPLTFAYGFRNPFRFSIDRETNEVWVGDVGGGLYEEIDGKVKAGGNYGWPCREGMHDLLRMNATKCPNPNATFVEPFVEHKHDPNPQASITGGFVYRGKALPAFHGAYVYGDYVTQFLWAAKEDPSTGQWKAERLNEDGSAAQNWVGFAEDQDGEVYAHSLSGTMYKLVSAGVQPPDTFPDTLSKTGCTDPADAKKPASGLVPFGVNSALWSDGALKDRYIALPDGKTITVKPDGDFDFPTGTVLVKHFTVASKLVETRLFIRHDDGGWGGYSYEWNDAQTDATLLRGAKSKAVGNQTWYFPGRSECMTCHTEAAGRSLGPELGQLNGDHVYPSTNRISNQLKTLDHIGYFSAPLGKTPDQIIAYPDPTGTKGTAEERGRSYFHSNCSHCHREKGGGGGDMVLTFGTPLKDTKTCNVDPQRGDLGVTGAKLLVPGDPSKSMLSLRPHLTGANRMPPLASSLVDDKGVGAIDAFVKGVTACPQ